VGKWLFFIICIPVVIFSLESTEDEFLLTPDSSEEVSKEKVVPSIKTNVYHLWSGEAKFKNEGLEQQHSTYSKGLYAFSYTHHTSRDNGIFTSLGYSNMKLEWQENPDFTKERFSYLSGGFGFFNKTLLNRWVLEGGLEVKVDPSHWNFKRYALYYFSAKGRYEFSKQLGIHVGGWSQIGLDNNELYPVVGVDYHPSSKWDLYLIFPRKIGAYYHITKQWRAAVQGRIFRSLHRLNSDESLSKGVFEYRATGVDLALLYQMKKKFHGQVFVGYKGAGDLKVVDSSGNNPNYYKFKGCSYIGLDLSCQF